MFPFKQTNMKKLLTIQWLMVLLVTGAGCTKFSDNINVDPNVPTKASNAQLLTYSITQMANTIESISGNLYVQHWSEKPYTDNSRYTVVNFDFYDLYTQPLENLQTILNAQTYDVNEGSA